jgi:hypothetical protein
LAHPHKTNIYLLFSEIISYQEGNESGVPIHLKYTMGQKQLKNNIYLKQRNKAVIDC